jgi:dienelactone hydrolase
MRSKLALLSAVLATFVSAAAAEDASDLRTAVHEYRIGDQTFEGYLARPLTKMASYPGVLVVHDWMGNGEFSREKARYLARLGYIVLAVDMYGKGVRATNAGEAGKLAGQLYQNPVLFRERILGALEELKKQPYVDASRIGAIGFCFGGTTVLELARSGADVAGVVSFHGGLKPLATPPAAGTIKARVLILHGNLDPHVPPADVAACMSELNAAQAHYKFVGYPDAVHAFTNPAAGSDPSRGAAYNEAADKAAFAEMEAFFRQLLE